MHKLEQAEAEMRAACDLDPHAVAPRILLARIYLNMGKSSDTEALYADLKAVAPDDPQAFQALGTYYLSLGQKEKALSEFQAVSKAHPKDNSTKAFLVETLIDLNRTADATPVIQEMLRSNSEDTRALVSQGRVFLSQGNYAAAQETLQKAIKAQPDSAIAYFLLGSAQQSSGLPDAARISFSKALDLHPQMAAASAALAGLAVRNGDYAEASRQAEMACKSDPDLPSANVASAQAMIARGALLEAEAILLEVLKADPASVPAWSLMLNVYVRQSRGREAVQRLAKPVEDYPQTAGLHFLLGLAYFSANDMQHAEASTRKALELDAKTPDAHTLLANIAFAKGLPGEAKAHLRTAIAAFPRNLMNYMALVTQYEKEGNWTEATRLCETAHEIDRTSPMVAAELTFLYLEHGGNVNAAVSLAQIAKQKMPDSPITADALGWAYYKLGLIPSAVAQLKESSQKVPGNPIYQYHLGMAYLAARQFDQAGQSLRAALRTDPQFPYAAHARAALEQTARGIH